MTLLYYNSNNYILNSLNYPKIGKLHIHLIVKYTILNMNLVVKEQNHIIQITRQR